MSTDLDERARAILKANDRGGYTVPTARLYPFQWNWDSALCALGFATFDMDRAFREIETLIEGQWDDGMIPHIVFRRPDPDYFPGPEAWGAEGRHPPGVATSGISQPPVLASVLRRLYERSRDAKRIRPLAEACARWHEWWFRARADEIEGDGDEARVVTVVHPWESGRDNCPDWDAALDNVVVASDLPAYSRRDTSHIDAEQRPKQEQYDRYMTIVKFGRDHAWEPAAFRERGPFRVADPGCHFILMRAELDLMAMSGADIPLSSDRIRYRHKRLARGAGALWNPSVGAWCALDMRAERRVDGMSSASALAWWAGAEREAAWWSAKGKPERGKRMVLGLKRLLEDTRYAIPSWDPSHQAFDAPRYWRGPVWAVVSFMVSEGLREAGRTDLADRIRDDARALIESAGFYEYFEPLTGRGLGGGDFAWTAAMWLSWCGPNAGSEGDA